MKIGRQNRYLNEAIGHLDQKLIKANNDVLAAYSLLDASELRFIHEEITNCIDNRVYYLTNYHCILTEAGVPMTLYPLWDHQWMVEEAIEKERAATGQSKIIVLKPRQAGITVYSSGCMCQRTFFLPHAYSVTVAQAPDVAADIFRKVNITYDHLPWWLRPERQYHAKDEMLQFQRKDELTRAATPGLGSVFVTTHSQRTTGVAIGCTVRSLHSSEVSRCWSSSTF